MVDRFQRLPEEIEAAAHEIIGAAIEVHRHLGPGLLESIYEKAMVYEMRLRGLTVREQVIVPVVYKTLVIEAQRLDLLVEPGIVVELKAVDALLPIHEAQVISYLKSTRLRLGLLINFKVQLLSNGGLKRIIL